MSVNKVDFLNDLSKTIVFLKSNIKENDKLLKLQFYTSGTIDDNNKYEKSFTTIDDIDMRQEDYEKAKKITMITMNNKLIKTIHCDKNTNMVAVTDNTKKEKEVNNMINEDNINNIINEDDCTYYEFEFGQIGKYDSKTNNYYLYDDGRWIISGTVMRWIEDPSYEYKIIKEPSKIPKL